MKKSTKFISLLLAVMLAVSCFAGVAAFPVSAADDEQMVYFDFPTDGTWGDPTGVKVNARSGLANIYCYAYAIYGNEKPYALGWQTRTTQCLSVGNNVYSFNLAFDPEKKGVLEDNADYGIIFSTAANGGYQTVDLTMTTECLGDHMYITPYYDAKSGKTLVTRENAADSHKVDYYAAWRNSKSCGPKATISSLGALLPGMFPAIQPKAQQLSNALKQYLTNPTNNPYFQYDNNMQLCEDLGVTPEAVYQQYLTDNAYIIEAEGATLETDTKVPCAFYRYIFINDQEKEEEGKLADPAYVREVLGVSDVEPTTEEPTTEEPTEEPTTEEPTTEEPTTEEPTTEEPTTEEPTTEEPTTEEPTTEPVPQDVYTAAGSSAAIFGTTWDAENTANDMTYNPATGLYEITYADVEAENAIQFKVLMNHSWDDAWGDPDTGDNYTFNVTDTCDVTITIDPVTKTVEAVGEYVTQDDTLDVETVIAVGNGEDNYLNGANWDPADESNALVEVADGIWEITYDDIFAFDNYQIKFTINAPGSTNPWAHNFGAEVEQLYPTGEEIDAVYNGKNCLFEVEEDESSVTFQLDLREFDFKTKQGAKFTITVTPPETEEDGIIGDVNGDGYVTVLDATLIQKYSIELPIEGNFNAKLADVNNDGYITVADAACVQRFAAEMTKKTGNAGVPYADITPASENPQIII